MTVIEEIDNFKRDQNELGRNARAISRYLDALRERGSLREGVQLDGGGMLRVDYSTHSPDLPIHWGPDTNDNRILRTVLRLQRDFAGNVAFITRDTNMRLKCDALGVQAEDYQNARIDIDEQYSGVKEMTVDPAWIDALYQHQAYAPQDLEETPWAQQVCIMTAEDGSGKSAMARWDSVKGQFRLVNRHKEGVWGIFARNKEQLFALEMLLDDSISLVTLNGVAGTGKTLLALACGLRKVADEAVFRKLLVSRPISPLGKDVGYLPGDLNEKLNPGCSPSSTTSSTC